MKKKEFEKSKIVTEKLLDALQDEFPRSEDVNGLMKRFCNTVECFMQNGEIEVVD